MKIKCVITDDEPLARKGLREYIEKIDILELVGECKNAIELNNLLQTTKIDLLFLDIEMPRLSGLDFLENLENPPFTIITSAYEKYALKSYEFQVSDYLLKPISFTRFLKAINNIQVIMEKIGKKIDPRSYIFVRSDKQLKKIIFEHILFVESLENYIIIYTLSSKEITSIPLKQFWEILPQNSFIQVHRSYIVNIDKIEAIIGNQLKIGDKMIPVGRSQREDVMNALNNYIISRKKE
ncbi:MAG: response regulator transcription factor [Dysgonomonas sp.]|nr:response regulator transcription factor [Dysgonomonas sp.]